MDTDEIEGEGGIGQLPALRRAQLGTSKIAQSAESHRAGISGRRRGLSSGKLRRARPDERGHNRGSVTRYLGFGPLVCRS
jgi:hypothetical protein